MLPLIYQHIEIHNLLPAEEFPDVVALSQMTPGPIAVNAATYIGFRNSGVFGSLFATLGVITPSLILVFLVLHLMRRFSKNPYAQAALEGVKPVTLGMIGVACIYFFERTILAGEFFSLDFLMMKLDFINLPALIIFITVIITVSKTKVSPVILTILSGIAAIFIF